MDGREVHHHRKKRHESGQHPNTPTKRFIDKAIYPVALSGPIFTIPQVLKIFVGKDATGVSALSWFLFIPAAVFWVWYGIVHKETPIIVTNVAWIFVQVLIVIGTLMYG